MESIAAELASSFVQSSLGFDSEKSKLDSLLKVRQSLEQSCSDETSSSTAAAAAAAQSWIDLMDGNNSSSYEGEENVEMLRDTFIKSLLEHFHPNNNTEDSEADSGDEIAMNLIDSSFACVACLINLRCSNSGRKMKKKTLPTPLFGHDFVTAIAADVVEALNFIGASSSSNYNTYDIENSIVRLLLALLRVDRPRNEMCISTVRDLILLPASSSTTAAAQPIKESVACVAQVLSRSITAGIITSIPSDVIDEEELNMRRETAVLNHLQDMRDVFYNVALVCSTGLSSSSNSGEDDTTTMMILNSIQKIYDIAEFAVESQLETLLSDTAASIITRLTRKQVLNNTDRPSQVVEDEGMEEDFDGKESQLAHLYHMSAADAMKPLYAKMAKSPVSITSIKQLESYLHAITTKLKNDDSELWDERLDALIHLECLLAGGVASFSVDARHLFIDQVRKMPIQDQFNDLRSQITHQACRFIIAFLFEFRDYVDQDSQLHQALSHFVDCCIPSILNLCGCAQSKIMSTAGMNCMLCLAAVCGTNGFPRIIPRLCEEILGGKKVHKNRKRGSVMALTAAVNVWESSCIVKHIDQLSKAVKEASTNSDPGVREEGRKFFWAMFACDETVGVVEKMFDGRSREMKNLVKVRDEIDAEWEKGGNMVYLVENGVLKTEVVDAETIESNKVPAKKTQQPTTIESNKVPAKKTQQPAVNPKRVASSSLKAKYGTPFKAQKASTPQRSVKCQPPPYSGTPVMDDPPQTSEAVDKSPGETETTSKIQQTLKPLSPRCSDIPMMTGTPHTNPARFGKSPVKTEGTGRSPFGSLTPKKTLQIKYEKENSPMMSSPVLRWNTASSLSLKKSSTMGSPVVNLLARASPLSAEKIQNSGDVLGEIMNMLSDKSSPQEQILGVKALALFAKESPRDPSWERKFSLVMTCLIDQIRNVPSRDAENFVRVLKSPPKQLNSCQQVQHLFLQGVRSLLQFVPGHVQSEDVRRIVRCMLECTENAPFEVVHSAEQALQNLISGSHLPEICFEELLPYTFGKEVEDALHQPFDRVLISNLSKLLSTLRSMRFLIEMISTDSLKKSLPSLMQLFQSTLNHASVDLRKATIFILVELHFVLGNDLILDDFTEGQRQLVSIYINRHPKKTLTHDYTNVLQPIAA